MIKILIEIDTDTQRAVPVEPTDKMLRVANEKVLGSGLWREGYGLMIAAASQACLAEIVTIDAAMSQGEQK